MRTDARSRRRTPRLVVLLALVLLAGLLGVPDGAHRAVADSNAALKSVTLDTRLSNGVRTVVSTNETLSATIHVKVGANDYQYQWGNYSAATCPVAIWLVVISRSDLSTVYNDNGSHGMIRTPCDGQSLTDAITQIAALPNHPLVVVNTLTSPVYGTTAVNWKTGWLTPLERLGFNTDVETVDLSNYSISGVGSVGWSAKTPTAAAYQVGQPVNSDYVTPTPASPVKTTANTDLRLVEDNTGNYKATSFAAATAKRVDAANGAMGWQIQLADGSAPVTTYSSGPASTDPSAWELTILQNDTLQVVSSTAYSAANIAQLGAALLAAAPVRNYVLLLRTSSAGNQLTLSGHRADWRLDAQPAGRRDPAARRCLRDDPEPSDRWSVRSRARGWRPEQHPGSPPSVRARDDELG